MPDSIVSSIEVSLFTVMIIIITIMTQLLLRVAQVASAGVVTRRSAEAYHYEYTF